MRFKWMDEVQVVNGYNRTLLYDLNRGEDYFVPNGFDNFIDKIERKDSEEKNALSASEKTWVDFLIKKDMIIEVPENIHQQFKPLDLSWDSPHAIRTTCAYNNAYLDDILLFLNETLCRQLVLFCDNAVNLNSSLIRIFENSNLTNLDIITAVKLDAEYIIELKSLFPIIGNVHYEQFKGSRVDENKNHSPYFIINTPYFSESKKFNTYFNRKAFFDKKGNLMSTKNSREIFGNISELKSTKSIDKVLNTSEFKKYWEVGKALLDICKDCELRHKCIDNRVPSPRKDGNWFHQEECNYNPYICKWKGEEGYQSLSKCGVVSDENEFSINHEKIAEINKHLWEEKPENA